MLSFGRRVRRAHRIRILSALLIPVLAIAAISLSSLTLGIAALAAALTTLSSHLVYLGAICPRCGNQFFVSGTVTEPWHGAQFGSKSCVHCGASADPSAA
jgi:ribosomal protein S27AE